MIFILSIRNDFPSPAKKLNYPCAKCILFLFYYCRVHARGDLKTRGNKIRRRVKSCKHFEELIDGDETKVDCGWRIYAVLAVSYHFIASPPITPSIPSLFSIHDQMLCFRSLSPTLLWLRRGKLKRKNGSYAVR